MMATNASAFIGRRVHITTYGELDITGTLVGVFIKLDCCPN